MNRIRNVFIYNHVRTPREKGRSDGALHEIPAVQLAVQQLEAIRERNMLDTALFDEVALGIAQPVAEQGGVLPRAALLAACYDQSVAGVYSRRILDKQIVRGRSTAAKRDVLLARIRPTDNFADLAGCELVIETVFEVDVKAETIRKVEAVIGDEAIYASNTSTLPITVLAKAS